MKRLTREQLSDIVSRASTLEERLTHELQPLDTVADRELSLRRLQRWANELAQGNVDQLAPRLRAFNVSALCAGARLGRAELLPGASPPPWTETLDLALDFAFSHAERAQMRDLSASGNISFPFEEVIRPFVAVARQKLEAAAGAYLSCLSSAAQRQMELYLLHELTYFYAQPFQFEFSAFRRHAGHSSVEVLHQGRRKHYDAYIARLLSGGLIDFFREYAVLARLLATRVDQWVVMVSQLIGRLHGDKCEIASHFASGLDIGPVIRIESGLSDRHDGGASVMVVQFESGLKIVYKPKVLDTDMAFSNFLDRLRDMGFCPLPRTPRVLSKEGYGWSEFIEYQRCGSGDELRQYYVRFGVLLCLITVLGATDVHAENLLACGVSPVLIDTETFMYPRLAPRLRESVISAHQRAESHLWDSVLRTGFFPVWMFAESNLGYDASGLGGDAGQITSFTVPVWHAVNTDGMRLTQEPVRTQPQRNRPEPDGVCFGYDMLDHLLLGYGELYIFLLERKTEFLANPGPLSPFRAIYSRYIARPTSDYAAVQMELLNPKYMREGFDRSLGIERLGRGLYRLGGQLSEGQWALFGEECRAMERLDIPMFRVCAGGTDLRLSNGVTVCDLFTGPGYIEAVRRIESLSLGNLARDIEYIRLSSLNRIGHPLRRASAGKSLAPVLSASAAGSEWQKLFLDTSINIAADLCRNAFRGDDGSVSWIGISFNHERQRYDIAPMKYSLYDGALGVGLFLSALYAVSQDSQYRTLSIAALAELRRRLRTVEDCKSLVQGGGLGAGSGIGSILFTLTRIADLAKCPELHDECGRIVMLMAKGIGINDSAHEFLSGGAGALLGLLVRHASCGDELSLSQAVSFGRYLLEAAVPTGSGELAWPTLGGAYLLGHAHGAGGIAYALARLYETTGDAMFLAGARSAWYFESQRDVGTFGNAEYIRQLSLEIDGSTCLPTWCHGIPGVVTSRLVPAALSENKSELQTIEGALQVMLTTGPSSLDHLCCGNAGYIETLSTAATTLCRPMLRDEAIRQAITLVERGRERGRVAELYEFLPALPAGAYNAGLFQGTCGVGYVLLRLLEPVRIPPILTW